MKINELYTIQKFQKISDALNLDLELLELKIKKGNLHIITKIEEDSGNFGTLRSFKDFKEFSVFLESFKKELNEFTKYQITKHQIKIL